MTVYILYSLKVDRYYVGQTEDLIVRLNQHNNKDLPYSYSKIADDWTIFYTMECTSRKQAVNIENHIKRMKSRKYIENLKRYPEIAEKLKVKYP
ncbi:MAG TPA: endonuclease [Cytophagales bacterium]|nr:endonuclease [Cytophagales bacterium]HRG10960.1 GIY-YIG nuclease family protein [Cyclobacteriaceae bacterium]